MVGRILLISMLVVIFSQTNLCAEELDESQKAKGLEVIDPDVYDPIYPTCKSKQVQAAISLPKNQNPFGGDFLQQWLTCDCCGEHNCNCRLEPFVMWQDNIKHLPKDALDSNLATYYMACPEETYPGGNRKYNVGYFKVDLGDIYTIDKIKIDFGMNE